MKRFLLVLITSVLTLGVLPTPSSAADPVLPVIVQTMNVCGNVKAPCPAGEATKTAASIVADVKARKVSMLGLQEVCANQAYRVRDTLGAGWKLTFTTTTNGARCDDYLSASDKARGYGQRFGTAILVRTNVPITRTVTKLQWGLEKRATFPDTEARSLICVTATVQGQVSRFCNTHFGFGADQTKQVASVVAAMKASPRGTVLTCDCNARPGSAPYNSIIAAGMVSAGGTGIDHIFVKSPGKVTIPIVARSVDVRFDHKALEAGIIR